MLNYLASRLWILNVQITFNMREYFTASGSIPSLMSWWVAFIITKMIFWRSGIKRVKNSPEQGKLLQTSHQTRYNQNSSRICIRKGTWQQNSLRIIMDSVKLQVLLNFEEFIWTIEFIFKMYILVLVHTFRLKVS